MSRGRRWLFGALGALLVVLGAGLATVGWALHSEAGSAWLITRVPFLTVTRPAGHLIGDFSAERVEVALGAGRLQIEGLRWRGLEIARAPAAHLWLRLVVPDLRAARIDWIAAEPAAAPALLPEHLRLPVEIDIAALHVDQARFGGVGGTTVLDLDASAHLSAAGGSVHRIEKAALSWGRLRLKGDAQIAVDAPFQLEAHLEAAQPAAAATPEPQPAGTVEPQPATTGEPKPGAFSVPPWTGRFSATGPLAAPLLLGSVRASAAAAGGAGQALDLRATLRPFAAWPLGDVDLRVSALDLSALQAGWPMTALNGKATATTQGLDQPGRLVADLANAAAGRWDIGRLPVRHLQFELAALPGRLPSIDLRAFTAELGSQALGAGSVRGHGGGWAERWKIEADLADVSGAALDSRAPALSLSGPVTLEATRAPAVGSQSRLDAHGRLAGRLAPRGTPQPASVDFDASLAAQRIEVRKAVVRAGATSASIEGVAAREAGSRWQVAGKAAWVDFDPAAWLPGPEGSVWRQGVHRLNGTATFAVVAPAESSAMRSLIEQIGAWHGEATVTLAPSVLGGVPLQGNGVWRNADGSRAFLQAALDADGNSARLEGQLGLAAGGAADSWDAQIDAPALVRLAPWWRMAGGVGGGGAPAARTAAIPAAKSATKARGTATATAPATATSIATATSTAPATATATAAATPAATTALANRPAAAAPSGMLRASVHVAGRWPALTTRGDLEAAGMRFGNAAAQKARAHWQLGTAPQAALELEADVAGASWNGAAVESLVARLSGTAGSHHAELRALSTLLPPAWTEALQGPAAMPPTSARAAGSRSVAQLQADGGIVGDAAHGVAGWRGTIKRLEWRPAAEGAAPWLRTDELGLDAVWAETPARLTLQPGRLEILGAGLRWSRLAWQAATPRQAMRLDVEADFDPIALAPWLRRLQPAFGWGGDLTLGGHASIRSAPAVTADVVVERRGGDLTVTDETGTQALGLTDLRFGLSAAGGVWNFTQALAGRALGVAAGAVVARTPAGATWPTAATPIEGVVELDVANLGTWGTWVPAGWRLGGALRTSASFGGRLGAPEYTGEIVGRGLSARNFLQGVDVVDGDVAIALQGTTARIERFSARAGEGRLAVEGDARFGEAPEARLGLTASRFQLLGRVDRRIVASGTAQLRLDRNRAALDGRLTVDEGLIDFSRGDAPTLGDDVVVIRRKPGPAPVPGSAEARAAAQLKATEAAAPAASARSLALDLEVGLGQRLRIRGRGLDAGLRGDLHLTSPAGRLAVNGTVYTVDGTYAAYGQKLAIDRGQLVFAGAIENPRLDIEATRPNLDIRVGVAVSGSALNPRVRLFSEPELGEMDKLSWLVLGRASEGLGRTDTALLQRAALALLAGESGGMGDGFIQSLGLDDLSVRQTEGEVRDTIVSLGKQISRRWYVGYERGLNATTGSFQLVYRIAQRFTLRAQSGADNSVDMIWIWRWQ